MGRGERGEGWRGGCGRVSQLVQIPPGLIKNQIPGSCSGSASGGAASGGDAEVVREPLAATLIPPAPELTAPPTPEHLLPKGSPIPSTPQHVGHGDRQVIARSLHAENAEDAWADLQASQREVLARDADPDGQLRHHVPVDEEGFPIFYPDDHLEELTQKAPILPLEQEQKDLVFGAQGGGWRAESSLEGGLGSLEARMKSQPAIVRLSYRGDPEHGIT